MLEKLLLECAELSFEEMRDLLAKMPQEQADAFYAKAVEETANVVFLPTPGPQSQAYYSEADVLLYGGSVGGGKSSLGLGLALNEHYRSLIIRKEFASLGGLIDTCKKLAKTHTGFVGGGRPLYRKPDGGVIHFAGLGTDGKLGGHHGVDHDLIYIDEAAQIPERQVRLLAGWLRTDRPGQRCRMVMGSNPPLDTTGDWLINFFAPWLDDRHRNPAKPGELRYFLPEDDGQDRECERGEWTTIAGHRVYAESRTFIPSSFADNPYYDPEEYARTLGKLPQQEREILISGNFMLGRQDDAYQVIPTDWVKQAMERWTPNPPDGVPQCAIGVDIAQGGSDRTVLAIRHDGWYAPLVCVPGSETKDGADVTALIFRHRRDNSLVIVDMGGGYGGSTMERLQSNNIPFKAYKGGAGSAARTADRQYGFFNKRAESYWRFMEALNPDQPGGSRIMLPPDPELLSDLTSIRRKKMDIQASTGVRLEAKEDLVKRLGRSIDKADAVVMAFSAGETIATSYRQWKAPAQPTLQLNRTYSKARAMKRN